MINYDKIKELYLNGKTARVISQELNISYKIVQEYTKKNNLKTIREQKLLNEILFMLKDNKTISEISDKLKVSRCSIYEIINKNEIHKNKQRFFVKLNEEKEEEITTLLKTTSLSLENIGKRFGISRQRVFAIQKSKNIKRKI